MVILFLAVFGGSGLLLGILTSQVFLIATGTLRLFGIVLSQIRIRIAPKHDLTQPAREANTLTACSHCRGANPNDSASHCGHHALQP